MSAEKTMDERQLDMLRMIADTHHRTECASWKLLWLIDQHRAQAAALATAAAERDKLARECEDLRKQSESWRMAHFAWQQWGDRMRDVVHCSTNGDEPTREAIEHRALSWRDQRDSASGRALKAEADRDRLRTLLSTCARKLGYLLRDYPGDKETAGILAAIAKEGLT